MGCYSRRVTVGLCHAGLCWRWPIQPGLGGLQLQMSRWLSSRFTIGFLTLTVSWLRLTATSCRTWTFHTRTHIHGHAPTHAHARAGMHAYCTYTLEPKKQAVPWAHSGPGQACPDRRACLHFKCLKNLIWFNVGLALLWLDIFYVHPLFVCQVPLAWGFVLDFWAGKWIEQSQTVQFKSVGTVEWNLLFLLYLLEGTVFR